MNREERINKAIAEACTLHRTIMQKAYNGTAAPRSAIKAQCLACVGYERLMVTHCLASAARFGPIDPTKIRWVGYDADNARPAASGNYLRVEA